SNSKAAVLSSLVRNPILRSAKTKRIEAARLNNAGRTLFASAIRPGAAAFADAVTVRVVAPEWPFNATVPGPKLHVIPATPPQENATLPANPPEGVAVSTNCVDWPATTVALAWSGASEKSAV